MFSETAIKNFLSKTGLDINSTLEPLSGGRNNRIYMVGDQFVVKEYFYHQQDSRNRLEHEYKFLQFAWEQRVTCVPQPINVDYNLNKGETTNQH